jgi:hypothetical protein
MHTVNHSPLAGLPLIDDCQLSEMLGEPVLSEGSLDLHHAFISHLSDATAWFTICNIHLLSVWVVGLGPKSGATRQIGPLSLFPFLVRGVFLVVVVVLLLHLRGCLLGFSSILALLGRHREIRKQSLTPKALRKKVDGLNFSFLVYAA